MSGAVAYAMSDYAPGREEDAKPGAVVVPATAGGCGKMHVAQLDEDGHPYIECEQCAPVLIGKHASFAGTPGGVPLTPDELGERELAERDAKATERVILRSVTDRLVDQIAADKKAKSDPAPSLMEQIGALSAKDRAELAKMLSGEPSEEAEEPKAEAKRGPGRPRTAR
jgi:hypothetical protein